MVEIESTSSMSTTSTTSPKDCHLRRRCAKVTGMRRLLASFVLSVLGCSLLVPLVLSATLAATTACCRRNGKHHCMSGISDMPGVFGDDSDPSLRAAPNSCPHSGPVVLSTFTGLHGTKFTLVSPWLRGIIAQTAAARGYRVAARERSARGPPESVF